MTDQAPPDSGKRLPAIVAGSWVVSGFLACSAALAEDPEATEEAPYTLNEVTVTATRSPADALSVPYSVHVLSATDLRQRRQVRTTPESFKEIPGIMVQKTGYGQGSPFIRGFTGFRTLFLIDGIRLNNSVFRDGPNQYWNTVDPLSVGHMEVVMGPGSVLYGSDAVGGTVQAFTRSYADLGGSDGDGFAADALGRVSSAENSDILRGEAGYRLRDGISVYGGASRKDFGDLDVADLGRQNKTGYDERDADFKAEYVTGGNGTLALAYQTVEIDDAWRTHRTIYAESWQGTDTGNELRRSLDHDRDLTYLQWRDGKLGPLEEITVSASFHSQKEKRKRIRSGDRTDLQGFDVDTSALWAQASTSSRFGDWTYGAEWYHDDVDSFRNDYNADGSLRSTSPQGPVADDSNYDLGGAFVQDTVTISDRLQLFLGGRYTYAALDAGVVEDPATGDTFSMKESWSEFTGSARFSAILDGDSAYRLYGGVSQAFRAPNLSDMTRLDTARSNEIETPVSDLDPEQFTTVELGIKAERDRWWGQLSAYYTDIDSMIIRVPTGDIIDGDFEVTKKNSGDGDIRGVELEGGFRIADGWLAFGNAAWLDGDVDTFPTSDPVKVREPLDRMMPWNVLAGLRWTQSQGNLWAEGIVNHSDNAGHLSSRDAGDTQRIPPGGTPAYTVVTLRGGWQLGRHTTLALAVENLLDEDYRIHGSGVNESGRNFVATLTWRP